MAFKPIPLPGGSRYPVVCAPLVGRTREALVIEAAAVAAKAPDLLEWRVDFYDEVADADAVLATARALRAAAGGCPILFTRRSSREGGQPIVASEEQVVAVYDAICRSRLVDLVDFEMDNDARHLEAVREMCRAAQLPLLLSFHDFNATPSHDVLVARFQNAQALGADVAKLAVMPRSMDDVLTLLAATLSASRRCEVPVVSMAMGGLGAVTRMCGSAFGSAMTFAVGQDASAPGQMPIAEIGAAVDMLRRAMGVQPGDAAGA